MPEKFENCVSEGGRVRTKSLSGNRYMRICYLKGKSFAGEVKTKKAEHVRQAKTISKSLKG